MELGSAIREQRKKNGVKQKDFATAIGLSVTALGLIERNVSIPKKETLARIASELRVSLPYLFVCALDETDVTPERRETFKLVIGPIRSLIGQLD